MASIATTDGQCYALTPHTVELIPTLGALSPPGPGPHTMPSPERIIASIAAADGARGHARKKAAMVN